MYSIQSNNDHSFIKIVLQGSVTVQDAIDLARDLSVYRKKAIAGSLLLTDARDANFSFSVNDLKEIAQETSKHAQVDKPLKEALLINSPKETALSLMFEKRKLSSHHETMIFNTEQSALAWLHNE